jgi:hypothetical protein
LPLLHTRRGAGYLFGPEEESAAGDEATERDALARSKKKSHTASKKNHA